MDKRFIDFYMDVAKRTAQLSRAIRLQVGAIVVKDDKIISLGYNGTPSGWDNECEYKHYSLGNPNDYELKTKPEVLHAERNALDKLAKGTESGLGSIMFVTHAPCLECAKSIYGAGIKEVYYANDYRETNGIEFLTKCNVKVDKLDV